VNTARKHSSVYVPLHTQSVYDSYVSWLGARIVPLVNHYSIYCTAVDRDGDSSSHDGCAISRHGPVIMQPAPSSRVGLNISSTMYGDARAPTNDRLASPPRGHITSSGMDFLSSGSREKVSTLGALASCLRSSHASSTMKR